MIESFKHKGLQSLFEQDDGRKVRADQVDRLRLILWALDQAGEVQDMNQPTSTTWIWKITIRRNTRCR